MLKSKKIAVIGFGDMGQLIGKYLLEAGNHTLTAVNRSEEKVIQFNQKFGAKVTFQPMEKLPQILQHHDIIISSISIPRPLIDRSHFEKSNPTAPFKLLVDISIPRSIHTNVDQVPSIIRFDMEHLAEVTQKTLTRKKAAISSVKALLAES